MESRIFGIPLAVIFFVVGIALLVDVPAVLMYEHTQVSLKHVESLVGTSKASVTITEPSPSVSPTATPSSVLKSNASSTGTLKVAPRVTATPVK